MARRKQQGTRRFLGTRDLIGCVEVAGVAGFQEASSRNQGLIATPQVEQLRDCVRDKCVRRLERYVVDITWKDADDKDLEDTSRIKLDASSALVARLVSQLAATDGVQLVEYNPDLVRIVDEKSDAFESSLAALELLAEKTGDSDLVTRVSVARERISRLEAAEAQAREAQRRADSRASAVEKAAAAVEYKYQEELERNQFLMAAAALESGHDSEPSPPNHDARRRRWPWRAAHDAGSSRPAPRCKEMNGSPFSTMSHSATARS